MLLRVVVAVIISRSTAGASDAAAAATLSGWTALAGVGEHGDRAAKRVGARRCELTLVLLLLLLVLLLLLLLVRPIGTDAAAGADDATFPAGAGILQCGR